MHLNWIHVLSCTDLIFFKAGLVMPIFRYEKHAKAENQIRNKIPQTYEVPS